MKKQQPLDWEALDIDDSESVSLSLLPNSSQPFLQRCSQTLTSQSLKSSNSPTLIPGPAGAVQSAMNRRAQNNNLTLLCRDDPPLPTQDYIRRAVENGDEDDGDFSSAPWLCALDFLRSRGSEATPLGSIKNGLNTERVAQVVAIIKSCTPNGLGDMMVTLKDPTGTMGASIHRKVLAEGAFGEDISVGAVLVLQKVAVFFPSRSACYLNITLSNLVKVISKDSEPPLKQNYPVSSVKHTPPVIESSKHSWMPQRTFSVSQERTEGIMNSLRQTSNLRRNAHNDKQMEKYNEIPGSGCFGDGKSRNQNTVVEKEPLSVRLGMADGIVKLAVRKDTTCKDQEVVISEQPNPCNQAEGGNPLCSTQGSSDAANLVDVPDDQESGKIIGVKKNSQPLITRTSLPQWTDEQLDELLAFD